MATKTTTKTAAAKNAAAVNTTTTTTAPRLSSDAIARISEKIVIGCNTCKDVAAKFSALVAEYGKEDAAAIQRAAKDIVTAYRDMTKDHAAAALETLKDGDKVARAAWRVLLEEEDNTLCRKIYEKCNCNLAAMVATFADYVGKDKDGREVAAVRRKDKDGKEYFAARDLSKVGGYLAALKVAIKNGKRAALGDKTYNRKEVEI